MNHHRPSPRIITCRNYRTYDPNALKKDFSEADFEPLYRINNVNSAWNYLQNILVTNFNKHAPIITKRVKGSLCPWLVPEIKRVMNNRDQMLRKFRKSKSGSDWDTYKRLRNSCTNLIRKARSEYHQNLLAESRNNPQSFWKNIKRFFLEKAPRIKLFRTLRD